MNELARIARARARTANRERCREIRERAGVSVIELAGLLGVTQTTLRAWEDGTHRPRTAVLLRWADALDILDETALQPEGTR